MSSSRRRKPLVTRKVLSDEEDDITSTNDEDSRMTNGDSQNKDEDIPEDLPEGTVVVEPEPVEESAFKGPEFPSSKKKVLEATGYLATVNCSACGDQINTSKKGDARRHPELSVLICKRCYKFHTSGVIKQDEDGLDEYCRWCSEGGNLFGCDYCHNAFCQACIKRNLGRAEFSKVKDADKFKCYVCDPAPLAAMVEQCNSVLDMINKEYEKLNESLKKKKDAEKQKSSSKSDSKDKTKEEDKSKATTNKSLVIKLPGMGPKTSTPKSKETSVSTSGMVKIPSTNSLSAPGMIKYPAINPSTSWTSKSANFVRQAVNPKQTLAPLQSMYNNTAKQNIIFVEPTKGSAKQLVYVQPKPHNVPMMSSVPPSQQARNPLNWTNVTAKNVPFITDQLMQSTNELLSLLKSVRINVQGSSNALSNIAFEGRMTAITCMKSGVDLFLGQLSSIVGTDIVQTNASKMLAPAVPSQTSQTAGVKLTGGNSSLISTSEKDLIVLDSDESRMEVEEITDSDKGNNSEKDTASCDIISIDSKDLKDKSNDIDKNEKKEESLTNGDKNVEMISEDKTSDQSKESEDSKKSKSDETKSDVPQKSEKKNDKESDYESSTEAENDAAHLELLQELQELSGAVEENKEEEKSKDKKEGKQKNEKKEGEKSKDKKEGKQKKEEEKSKDKKEGKQKKEEEKSRVKKESIEKNGKMEDDKSINKNESSDDDSSSGSESDDEDSDNSKDSDFNVKSERRTRRSDKKAAEKKKFQDLRNKRKERERSAKKKAKKDKRRKGSDESDFNDELEDEIEKLEKDPVIKKEKGKKEKDDKGKSKKEKKTEKKKDEKSIKEKKKGTDLDDLSSTEEDNVEEDEEEEDKENEEVPMDADDDDATEDLSGAENEDEDVVDDSSDSEIVLSPRKKKKGDKKKGKTESGSNTEEEEVIPPKKKRLRSSLLDAKLSDSESDFQPLNKKQKKRKASSSEDKSDNSSDSDQKFIALGKKGKGKNKKNQKKKDGTGKKRKRIKKVDSSDEGGDDSANETEAESDELEEMKNKKKRKRKKKGEEDSEEDQDEDDDGSPSKAKRKDIRKLMSNKKLKDSTKAASRAEEERRARITEKQKKYNNIIQEVDESSPTKCPITKQLILEREEETNEPILEVDQDLVAKLKPHQVEAVEFLWNCTVESLKMLKEDKTEGAGCILAHCMGLGKTLSVIAFLHTMMGNYETTEFSTALIVCPLNTVLNWQHEVKMWLEKNEVQLEVHELASVKVNESRAKMLEEWHEDGGIMIIGYEMFRNLSQGSNCKNKRIKASFRKTLVDPGPDFVVCDEGHILKNDASALSKAMMQIKTRRRIVLTGTPLQNNLVEYHCMVNFVKPNLLGTRKEFLNRFVNPITNGQCTDSSSHDVRLMKRRAHILHEKLAGCVQRKDYSALTKYLPPKQEYVIAVRLANVQCDLYSKYLEIGGYSGPGDMGKSKGAKLFSDYQALMRIWTHPWVLKMAEVRQEMKNMFDDESSFIDDTSSSESESEAKSTSAAGSASDNSFNSGSDEEKKKKKGKKESEEEPAKESFAGEIVKKWKTRSRGEYNDDDFERLDKIETPFSTGWWADYVKEEDQFKMELGGKLMLLFEILRMCEEIGDKVLIFSQSLLSLDLIEAYLDHVDSQYDELLNNKDKDKKEEDKEKDDKKEEKDKPESANTDEMFGKTWLKGQDYLRMDGSTSAPLRADMAKNFNNPDNYRLRLFLISTKAGGLGINLVAANRVIIFDASWNPSHDVQSIFRVYRFGQTKPVYVYRFLAQGTMEEKIYERQVTKQSLSQRVIDEHQIDRHFDSNDLRELYIFKPDRLDDPNRTERPTPALPKDTLLAELLTNKKDWIVGYHEHDSLLENKIDQELSEEERKAAWEEFENEKKGLINTVQQRVMGMPNPNFHYQFGAPGMPGMGGMSPQLNQENLLRIVQEMKSKFPHLPQEQLTMQVQNVIRNMISRQIQQQQWEQRRQLEHRELQQQQQLQQLQNRIMMQQNQLRMQQQGPGRGMNMPLSGIQPPTSSASSSRSLLASTLMNGNSQNQPSTSKKKS